MDRAHPSIATRGEKRVAERRSEMVGVHEVKEEVILFPGRKNITASAARSCISEEGRIKAGGRKEQTPFGKVVEILGGKGASESRSACRGGRKKTEYNAGIR